jgi:hypothetical protein
MKESYGEDLAGHTDPESCAVARKGIGRALPNAGGIRFRSVSGHHLDLGMSLEPSGNGFRGLVLQ